MRLSTVLRRGLLCETEPLLVFIHRFDFDLDSTPFIIELVWRGRGRGGGEAELPKPNPFVVLPASVLPRLLRFLAYCRPVITSFLFELNNNFKNPMNFENTTKKSAARIYPHD